MEIIMHRANMVTDWVLAKENGWGIEVDLRTHLGAIYLSHDPIEEEKWIPFMPSFTSLIGMTEKWTNTVVLDCKETGLLKYINGIITPNHSQYAMTDLIVPDQLRFRRSGLRTLTRKSIYEGIHVGSFQHPFISRQEEFWVDYVFTPKDLEMYSNIAADCYVVSPELHKYQDDTTKTLFEKDKHILSCELTDEFINAVYDLGFKGVCTHEPNRYASRP